MNKSKVNVMKSFFNKSEKSFDILNLYWYQLNTNGNPTLRLCFCHDGEFFDCYSNTTISKQKIVGSFVHLDKNGKCNNYLCVKFSPINLTYKGNLLVIDTLQKRRQRRCSGIIKSYDDNTRFEECWVMPKSAKQSTKEEPLLLWLRYYTLPLNEYEKEAPKLCITSSGIQTYQYIANESIANIIARNDNTISR